MSLTYLLRVTLKLRHTRQRHENHLYMFGNLNYSSIQKAVIQIVNVAYLPHDDVPKKMESFLSVTVNDVPSRDIFNRTCNYKNV